MDVLADPARPHDIEPRQVPALGAAPPGGRGRQRNGHGSPPHPWSDERSFASGSFGPQTGSRCPTPDGASSQLLSVGVPTVGPWERRWLPSRAPSTSSALP